MYIPGESKTAVEEIIDMGEGCWRGERLAWLILLFSVGIIGGISAAVILLTPILRG